MENIKDLWKRAVKCTTCNDTGWILFDKPMPELYGDKIPITFAKRCSCGYREKRGDK